MFYKGLICGPKSIKKVSSMNFPKNPGSEKCQDTSPEKYKNQSIKTKRGMGGGYPSSPPSSPYNTPSGGWSGVVGVRVEVGGAGGGRGGGWRVRVRLAVAGEGMRVRGGG